MDQPVKKPVPIRVQELNHAFGKGELRKQILFDVSTEVRSGEIVIVTGPSGSGKTTMLTLVGALRSAQDGSVRVLGEELLKARSRTLEKVRRQIGFIFQQHNLLGALTAVQNVELGIRASGRFPRSEHRKRSKEMLEAVGLGDRLHYKPEQLSGGQRQRVAIARALVSEPAMVLADEPTASLDKQSGREVVERMKTLAREHDTTILLVTHDNRILDIADRIIHLEDGRLSTFTDAVIANNKQMMQMLADNRSKQPIQEQISELSENEFRDLLQEMTDESERFLEATALANNVAFRSMLTQGLFAFTNKLGDMLRADRVSLFVADGDELVLTVTDNMEDLGGIRFPVGVGIAGAVAQSGSSIRIDDAYADPRFNQEVDRQTGYRTHSILCLPLKNRNGEVFAVAQLLNRKDRKPFDADDERRFAGFMESIGVILETQLGMGHSFND
jgi:putative ABC transport system ATP-binding protein